PLGWRRADDVIEVTACGGRCRVAGRKGGIRNWGGRAGRGPRPFGIMGGVRPGRRAPRDLGARVRGLVPGEWGQEDEPALPGGGRMLRLASWTFTSRCPATVCVCAEVAGPIPRDCVMRGATAE